MNIVKYLMFFMLGSIATACFFLGGLGIATYNEKTVEAPAGLQIMLLPGGVIMLILLVAFFVNAATRWNEK